MILTPTDATRSTVRVEAVLVLGALSRQVSLLFAHEAGSEGKYHFRIVYFLRLSTNPPIIVVIVSGRAGKEGFLKERQFRTGSKGVGAPSTLVTLALSSNRRSDPSTWPGIWIGVWTVGDGVASSSALEASDVFVIAFVAFVPSTLGVFCPALFFGYFGFGRCFGFFGHGNLFRCVRVLYLIRS